MLVAEAANNNTESSAKQVWIFDTHHEAVWIVTEIVFPVLQLSVAHDGHDRQDGPLSTCA